MPPPPPPRGTQSSTRRQPASNAPRTSQNRDLYDRLDEAVGSQNHSGHSQSQASPISNSESPLLDSLSVDRVIRRALDLEARTTAETGEGLSEAKLIEIANSLGIEERFVLQALQEQAFEQSTGLGKKSNSRLADFVLQDGINVAQSFDVSDREELEEWTRWYLSEYEGLVPNRILHSGASWQIDDRAVAKAKTALSTGNNRISKHAGSDIYHQVLTGPDNRNTIVLRSSGAVAVGYAKLGVAMSALSVLGGVVAALFLPIIQVALVAALCAIGFAGGGLWWARQTARTIRSDFRRSLTALAQKIQSGDRTGSMGLRVKELSAKVQEAFSNRSKRPKRPRR